MHLKFLLTLKHQRAAGGAAAVWGAPAGTPGRQHTCAGGSGCLCPCVCVHVHSCVYTHQVRVCERGTAHVCVYECAAFT